MVAGRLGCQGALVVTGYMGPILALAAWTGLENGTLSHLVGVFFLAGMAAWHTSVWTIIGCLTLKNMVITKCHQQAGLVVHRWQW